MTTTSALSVSCVIRKPARAMRASIRSLSTIFLGQPRAMKPTVVRFVFFLISIGRYHKVFDGYHKVVILNNSLKCFF